MTASVHADAGPKGSAAGEPLHAQLALALIDAWDHPVVICDAQGRLVLTNAQARAQWNLPADLDAHVPEDRGAWFGEHPDHAACGDPLSRALTGETPLKEWRLLCDADGCTRSALVSARTLVAPCGQVLGAEMRILEVGDESMRQERLRTYAADLEMMTEVSRLLSEASDPEDAASMICTVATGATGAIATVLWGLQDDELCLRHHESALAGDVTDLHARLGSGAARALADGQSTIERLARGVGESATTEGTASDALTVWHEPLVTGGRPVGVLSILWGAILSDLERPCLLIGSLAHHAATALERADLLRRLGEAARTDPLTGLANRRTWHERVHLELPRAGRDGQPLSLILIDIDHFKSYNDRFGHPQGDELLQDAARAWSQRLRRTDLLARIGGEEFAVLLPGCDSASVHAVAESLREAMPHGQTCSLGLVTTAGLSSPEELYAAADAALYCAKRGGRNRAEVGALAEHAASPAT